MCVMIYDRNEHLREKEQTSFLNYYLFMYSANVVFLERECNSCFLSDEGSEVVVCVLVGWFGVFFFVLKQKGHI